MIKSIAYIADAYKGGYVPPGALSWNDADDNNAFHSKLMVMDFDGTISTEVALYHDKEQYNDIATLGLPAKNDGKPNAAQLGVGGALIPKGAKNVEVAKEFMKFLIQPKVMNAYLKQGLGRWLPAYPSLAKSDPFWLDPSDPHRANYVREGLIDPTLVNYPVVQSRLCRGQRDADLGVGRSRRHQKRVDTGTSSGQSVKEDRDDPGKVPDRSELRGSHGKRICH